MARVTFLLNSEIDLLKTWGTELHHALGHTAYLVGSALTTKDYRDVDVRVIVPDEHFQALAERIDMRRLHLALSLWGQQVTGLPIDCQVQSETNSRNDTGRAHPLRSFGPQP